MNDYAHIRPCGNGFETQSIRDHSDGVADLAAGMADAFGAGAWARLCGLWHDIGKYSEDFQRHIIASSGIDPTVKDPGIIDHATAGALYAKERLGNLLWLPVSYCICGHHSGLMDYVGNGRQCLSFHMSQQEHYLLDRVRASVHDTGPLPQVQLPSFIKGQDGPKQWHLWMRMLFSCLVDADWLDTERFMQPDNYRMRGCISTLKELRPKLDDYVRRLGGQAQPTPVNAIREEVQDACRKCGSLPQGIYSLTVPTGGGKTISSVVWAMEHAMCHDLRRIIVAIPYTSIVAQTADTLRKVFGPENVVEHHSCVDFNSLPEQQRQKMSLATENWDAPIIVTTNVQLFESLFSNKTSRCRKLHNLARSVLILDEVQTLPAENLHPVIDILNALSSLLHVSILLTTATQPAFSGTIGSGQAAFEGLQSKEIISDKEALFAKMRRVNITFDAKPCSLESLATRLSACRQALCVVNTRGGARRLYDVLPDKANAFHLSRMMCQQHISDKLAAIKERLREGEPVIAVSTQLVEAGVDIDFPVVWREMAGLDSIAQAAGRCNREGRLGKGKVVVFSVEGSRLRGVMAKAASTTQDLLYAKETDFLNPKVAKRYFRLFYAKLNDTDKSGVTDLLYRPCPQFAEAAQSFRMIDGSSITVYVPYGKGKTLLEQLQAGCYSSSLLRQLQRYSVSVPLGRREDIEMLGAVKLGDYLYMLPDGSNYNDDTGLTFENKWLDDDLII